MKIKRIRAFLPAALLIILLPTFAQAQAPANFSFTGSGYGHGVGMSQIGAKARALAGESATAILQYYYKDVLVTPVVDSHTIRVNIGSALKEFSVAGTNLRTVVQLFDGDLPLNSPAVPLLSVGVK
jgi:stage II sporulation protein D